jgi:hypothetical protein
LVPTYGSRGRDFAAIQTEMNAESENEKPHQDHSEARLRAPESSDSDANSTVSSSETDAMSGFA